MDALQAVRGFTGYEGSSAGDLVGEALRELSQKSQNMMKNWLDWKVRWEK